MPKTTSNVALTETWVSAAGIGEGVHITCIEGGPIIFRYAAAAPAVSVTTGHLLYQFNDHVDPAPNQSIWMRAAGGTAIAVVTKDA